MTTPQTHRVFVYGTLKTGYGNYHAYLRDARFAGQARSPAKYKMLQAGYPVLIEVDSLARPAAGELFHVDDETLACLDRLEGEGAMYDRKVIEVREHGIPVLAYVYVGRKEFWHGHSRMPQCEINRDGAYEWHPRPETR